MASIETGALLTADTTEPVTPATRRWTQVGFGAAAVVVLISLFTGDDGIIASIIFAALAIGLAYLGYRYLVMGKVPADLGLSYVACGMWPLLVSFAVITFLWGLIIMLTSSGIVRAWNPLWYRNIKAAGKDLTGHGDLLVNGQPMRTAMNNYSGTIHHHGGKHHDGKHHGLPLPHAVSRAYLAIPTVTRAALRAKHFGAYHVRETDQMPSLQFQDGTNAAPLIAKFLRSLAGVPYSLLIFVGFIYVVGLSYALQALVYAFTIRPLKRPGATLTSVVACSRAIVIGFVALGFIVRSMSNIVAFVLFAIYAVFELGLCTLISLRAYANDHAVLEPERKPVLIEPVILQFVYSYIPLIGIYIFFKNAVPIVANIVDQVVTPREGSIAIAKWFIAIPVAFLPQLLLMIYAVRIARKRYHDAVSVL